MFRTTHQNLLKMKKIFGYAAFVALLSFTSTLNAQDFNNPKVLGKVEQAIKKAKVGNIVALDEFLTTAYPEVKYTKEVLPGPQFLISDDPEYIRQNNAIAMQENVAPGAVRLYVYNVNGIKEPQQIKTKITAVIKNTGKEKMTLRMLKYSSQKPSLNYFAIGKKGLEDFFNSNVENDVRYIQPGEVIAIDPQLEKNIVSYDELVHGFYEFVVDQPGQISILQTSPEKSGPEAYAQIKTVIPNSHENAGRGIFGVSNYKISSADTISTANGVTQLVIADGESDPWVTGTVGENKDFAQNAGNYGVMYHTKLKWKSTDGKGLALVTWNSRSADNKWCGGMGLTMDLKTADGKSVVRQLPSDVLVTKAAPEAILVEIYKPDPTKEIQEIEFIYSPPGASCLPTPLVLIPIKL